MQRCNKVVGRGEKGDDGRLACHVPSFLSSFIPVSVHRSPWKTKRRFTPAGKQHQKGRHADAEESPEGRGGEGAGVGDELLNRGRGVACDTTTMALPTIMGVSALHFVRRPGSRCTNR